MKNALFIFACLLGLTISILCFVLIVNKDNPKLSNLSECLGLTGKNLLKNADFKDGLMRWNHDINVSAVKTNSINCVSIEGDPKRQLKLWQGINVSSNSAYRFTFTLTGPDKGAFAVFKNPSNGGDINLYCSGNNNKKHYSLEINPSKTGSAQVYLSTKGTGYFYFSDIKFVESHKKIIFTYTIISVILATTSILLLLRFNTIFFAVVCILMLVPIAKISKEKQSEAENRNLNEYKPLFSEDKKLNTNYALDLSNWINDHFFLRSFLIKNYDLCKIEINNRFENDFIFEGNSNFYFKRSEIKDIIKYKYLSEEEHEETAKSFKTFFDFCKKNNIELYVFVAPYGFEVYYEELKNVDLSNYAGCFSNTINKINHDYSMNILYGFDSLRKAKNDGMVYYKTDHHWTPFGAYIGYRLVIDEIMKKFEGLTPSYEQNYTISSIKNDKWFGSFFLQLNLDKSYYDKAYPKNDLYLNYKFKGTSISGVWKDVFTDKSHTIIKNNKGYNKKVFLFGDSFIRYYYPFFTHTFSETYLFFKKGQIYMPEFEKIILNYKPDIVILNIYADNFKRIKYWYEKGK